MTRVSTAGDAWSTWSAPAKLNLFLHIVGRRADGYHLLQTAFQLLDWGDEISLRVRSDGQIHRHDPLPDIPEAADLVVRAARALREASGCGLGADIGVVKRIPLGGGLGGGSSDAATALVGLNALWGCGLDVESLARIGLGLGADVPVFVRGHSAWAEGIGEALTELALPEPWYVIVDPGASVPTAELFAAPELTRAAPQLTIPRFLAGESTVNAFEPVVRTRYPRVASALDWLGQHGQARLSGSGGCIFTAVNSEEAARRTVNEVPAGMRGIAARGVNESPLMTRLRDWQAKGQ